MAYETIAQQMVVLGFCVLVGFIARKCKVMDDKLDAGLSVLLLQVTLPCMIIGAVICRDSLPKPADIGLIFVSSWAMYALILVIALILPRLMRLDVRYRGTYSFMLTFGNVGFIGFPVCNAIFGPESLLIAAIFNIPFNILVFTVGIMMLKQDSEPFWLQLKRLMPQLRSPTLAACVASLVLALLGVCNTGFVGEAVSTVGSMTTPAAMLVVGSSLAKMPAGAMLTQLKPYIMAAFRLIIIPLLVWVVFRHIISDPTLLGVLVITSGMPVASNATLLGLRYGGDMETIARGTFITTLFSLVTIPLLTTLIA